MEPADAPTRIPDVLRWDFGEHAAKILVRRTRHMDWILGRLFPALSLLGSLIWIYGFVQLGLRRGTISQLSELSTDPPPDGWPSVSVIFAARDEAGSVGRAARTMLSQDYPTLRVIAIDDRSKDGTSEILDTIAAEDSRLIVVHVHELPEGWLGKCHALQRGAELAGPHDAWLLFTDADVMFAPGSIKRAVGYALKEGLDHLTLSPDVPTEFFVERVFMTMFCLAFMLYAPPWRLTNPGKKAALGVGAFNLVRTVAFEAVGGFRNIRLSIDDDMKLGQILKFAGYRNGFLSGKGEVRVRWHVGARNMILGLEKNFFAGIDYRPAMIPISILGIITASMLPFVGLFLGPGWVRIGSIAGIASACGIIALTRRQSRLAWYHALFLPLGGFLFIFALLRSTCLTLKRGGVSWRGHLYPLALLKEHVRVRNRWMKELWLSTR